MVLNWQLTDRIGSLQSEPEVLKRDSRFQAPTTVSGRL